jgi:transforming growth factor-beta-induced protein
MPPRSWLALLLSTVTTTASAYDDSCPSNVKPVPRRVVLTAQKGHEKTRQANLLETASSTGKFMTLVNAVAASGLIDVLVGHQDFTILAPTDQAFRNLPQADIEALLRYENRAKLREILTYHVIKGRVSSEDLAGKSSATTVNGSKVTIASNKKGLAINEATVLQADIRCTNGVIHVIDRVLTPPTPDILTTAERAGSFSTLLTAIKAAGLVDALQADGPFTVFAPTDEAFAKLPKETLRKLLDPHNKQALVDVLKLHVVSNDYEASDLAELKTVPTLLEGKSLAIAGKGAKLRVTGVNVLKANIKAGNGIIHVVDEVLMPKAKASSVTGVAESSGQFKILLAALKATGLDEAVDEDGPFTILAPTDAAFAKIPEDKLKALLQPSGKADLKQILKYHVLPGKTKAADLFRAGKSKTLLSGKTVEFNLEDGRLIANQSKFLATDVPAGESLIQVIDTVLIP